MNRLKGLLVKLVTLPGVTAPFLPLTRDRGTVFMLHRFRDPDRGVPGHDAAAVRRSLEYLRRKGYELVGIEELLQRLAGAGEPLRRAIAFTIDDGYSDQASVAAPLFAEYDCPVTTFVTTGFLDGNIWFWWDQIEYVFEHTERNELRVQLGERERRYRRDADADWRRGQTDFTARAKAVSDARRLAGIVSLATAAEVELPARVPAKYAAMSWDQLRACEVLGMTFGPHTVTHPILSRASATESRRELVESWQRLCSEARRPVPVFCYPNGLPEDFGTREIEVLKELGMQGALTAVPGYADGALVRSGADHRFVLNRFSYPDQLPYVVQYASGVERFKQLVRGQMQQ